MGSSFGSYNIARSGLFVNERGLFVTGQNISNVNTPGYARQQAMIKNAQVNSYYSRYGLMQIGLGADIQETRQIRNIFLDNVFRQENTTLGYWDVRQKTFQDVQAVIGEPLNSGLQNVLNQFWDSWQELSKDPDSLTVRAMVRQRGEALAQQINHMGDQLDKIQSDLNDELVLRLDEINQITSQVAQLNSTILESEVSGDSANDYRDQRNLLIDKLSNMADIVVNETQDGEVDISLGGYLLVQKAQSTNLYAAERNPGEVFYVPKLEGTNTVVPVKSGTLKGILESRGEVNGVVGSYENGTPNTKADVVFYVDTSTMSVADAQLRADKYMAELQKRGLDCNVTVQEVASADDFASAIDPTKFRSDSNKYAVFITNNVPGNMAALQTVLTNAAIDASAVTDTDTTDPSNKADAEAWSAFAAANDGTTYDYDQFSDPDETDYTAFANSMAGDTNTDVNDSISVIPDSMNIVSDMRKRLNALVNVMLREINYLHSNGKTMGDDPKDGEDFFTVKNTARPLEMGNIQVNPDFSNLTLIAASKSGANEDNTNALEIADLRNKTCINDSTGILSLDDYYQSIVLHMANSAAEADGMSDSQGKLVQSVDANRTSISGVSMDEEMSNMMKFKFAYDAASRVLNIIDTMTDTIVNKMGLAGR